jgi:steroid delta-isomerase-like uncharacterized protein
MSDANVLLLTRWFEEVWNQKRKATILELFAPDGIAHGVNDQGGEIQGVAELLPFYERISGAFPDMKIVIEDGFSSGDKVIVRWSAEMHHHGDNLVIPPSGKKVAIGGMTMARIKDGKIVEAWDSWDKLGMLQQIGVVQLQQAAQA